MKLVHRGYLQVVDVPERKKRHVEENIGDVRKIESTVSGDDPGGIIGSGLEQNCIKTSKKMA